MCLLVVSNNRKTVVCSYGNEVSVCVCCKSPIFAKLCSMPIQKCMAVYEGSIFMYCWSLVITKLYSVLIKE